MHFGAAFGQQELHVIFVLHPLGQHRNAETVGQDDGGTDNGRRLNVAVDGVDEGAVNLDLVEGKMLQGGERGISGAVIIHRDLDTEGLQLAHHVQGMLIVGNNAGFGDFQFQTRRRQAGLKQDGLPRPVVASLNGTAAGAGAVIALASDVRIAADSAKIAFLFVKVGLSGADMGAAHLLPRVVGLGRAAELLMTGDFVDAAEAYRIGLYNQVVPAADLARATAEMAHRLARGPRAGLAATKDALFREMDMDLHAALGHEARVQAELMRGADFREGFRAFQERRRPRFEGTPE